MSNNMRARRWMFSGMLASLPEGSDDFFIDKFSKGDKGLLSIPLGARTTRLLAHRKHILTGLATKTLFTSKQIPGE
jgi:hypothetical protein